MNNKLFYLFVLLLFSSQLFSQTEIVLQPGSTEGMDARVQSNLPDQNIGTTQMYKAHSGTMSGVPFIDRSLINFDLSSLPENAIIVSAKLSLFANTVNGGHSTVDGPNNCWIEKIIQPWEEETVTWNNQPATTTENRVALAASQSFDANYIDINVTNLIKDIFENPSEGFGLMLKLQNETLRRSLEFGSSDAPDDNLHPKLVINYYEAEECSVLLSDDMDARVQSNIPDQNIATSQVYKAHSGTMSGEPFLDRSLINFNLSELPENAVIVSAQLSLYANTVNGGHSTVDGPNNCWLEKITEPWEEEAVTWNNQPATTTENRVALAASQYAEQNYLHIDVTTLMKEIHENPDNGFGLMLKLQDESLRRSMEFGSSNAPDPEIRPTLLVCYDINTSVEEQNTVFSPITISPNPASRHLELNWGDNGFETIQLLDAQGKKIAQFQTDDLVGLSMDVGTLAPGVYFVQFRNQVGVVTRKFVKS
ncbi:MAG: T9SS C-terminal target domain-containing protein [Bacteroidetes bacterium]|nr:MAG: T9SS C-terminal target domain-containing protein [Bacteroidota bacterium]